MSGKGTDSFDAEYSEEFLPYWRKELSLGEDAGVIIESSKDVRDLLKHYYDWIRTHATLEEVPDNPILELCNMKIPCGFTMIWGAPDYLKTHIACALANEAFEKGERVVFFDTENKVVKGMLRRGIYYVPGTAKTPQVARKLATNHMFDFYVFDTIYAMSDHEPTLRSLVKHGRPNLVRYLLINQFSIDISTGKKVPSGSTTTKELAQDVYRVVKKGGTERNTFAKFEGGLHFFFDVTRDGLVYNKIQSRWLAAVNNADVIKLGKEYKYDGRLMSKAQIIALWQQQERLETSLRITSSESSNSTEPEPRKPEDPEQSVETPTSTEPALP